MYRGFLESSASQSEEREREREAKEKTECPAILVGCC